ncbi:MAG: apolipoprotein N-acyltransferase [Rhodocyclaceae bacterium]|nr:apolipoprotein N-acyltransferase [Rhodocyclaceae bacterium]
MKTLLPAFALGLAAVFAFAPFEQFWLMFVLLALLFRRARGAAPARAARIGFAFGLGQFLAGVSWVYVSMHEYGGMAAPLAALATLLFSAYLALYPALALAAFAWLRARAERFDLLAFAAALALADMARGWVFTGFPWLAIGYSQTPPSPLAGFAPLTGTYGLSFLTALGAACIGAAWRAPPRRVAAALLTAVVLVAAGWLLRGIEWTVQRPQALSVALLQGNIEQSLKWRPDLVNLSLARYVQLARDHPAQLVLLPETALPLVYERVPEDYIGMIAAPAMAAGGDLLIGAVRGGDGERYYNSVIAAASGAHYDKEHLVPFGEYTPPLFSWTLRLLHIPMADLARGAADQPPISVAGERVGLNICFEDLFGASIAAAAAPASLLANVSNTAWFGHSAAQPQHLQIARMRALETGRVMLRATNTGMTAVIDADGRVRAALEAFTSAALRAEVHGRDGLTPYMRWRDYPVLLLCACCIALCLRPARALPARPMA